MNPLFGFCFCSIWSHKPHQTTASTIFGETMKDLRFRHFNVVDFAIFQDSSTHLMASCVFLWSNGPQPFENRRLEYSFLNFPCNKRQVLLWCDSKQTASACESHVLTRDVVDYFGPAFWPQLLDALSHDGRHYNGTTAGKLQRSWGWETERCKQRGGSDVGKLAFHVGRFFSVFLFAMIGCSANHIVWAGHKWMYFICQFVHQRGL